MIDWLKLKIPLRHSPINDGCIVRFDRDRNPVYSTDLNLSVESSHSTVVQVKSSGEIGFDGFDKYLLIDGNINKFFNGHNITGTDDVISLVARFVGHLLDSGAIVLHPFLIKDGRFAGRPTYQDVIHDGDFIVKRIDINYMYRVSGGTVDEYVDFLADVSRTRFSRTTQPGSGTVYWNQKSTHWAMKCYNKTREMNARKKSHQLPQSWSATVKKQLHDLCEPYARFELVLRARKLREIAAEFGYNDAYWSAFQYTTDENGQQTKALSPIVLFQSYMDKIQVSEMERFSVDDAVTKLKPAVYGTFAAWRSGVNVRDHMTKRTYYRHRSDIIEALGVDITLSSQNLEKHAGTSTRVFRIVQADSEALTASVQKILLAA